MGRCLSHSKQKHSKKELIKWHTRFGKHSLIPDCCIEFWLGFYYKTPYQITKKYKEWRKQVGASHWGYIPCPICVLQNHRIVIHKCGPECEGIWRLNGRSIICGGVAT